MRDDSGGGCAAVSFRQASRKPLAGKSLLPVAGWNRQSLRSIGNSARPDNGSCPGRGHKGAGPEQEQWRAVRLTCGGWGAAVFERSPSEKSAARVAGRRLSELQTPEGAKLRRGAFSSGVAACRAKSSAAAAQPSPFLKGVRVVRSQVVVGQSCPIGIRVQCGNSRDPARVKGERHRLCRAVSGRLRAVWSSECWLDITVTR